MFDRTVTLESILITNISKNKIVSHKLFLLLALQLKFFRAISKSNLNGRKYVRGVLAAA